jgi:hypothetical protein
MSLVGLREFYKEFPELFLYLDDSRVVKKICRDEVRAILEGNRPSLLVIFCAKNDEGYFRTYEICFELDRYGRPFCVIEHFKFYFELDNALAVDPSDEQKIEFRRSVSAKNVTVTQKNKANSLFRMGTPLIRDGSLYKFKI